MATKYVVASGNFDDTAVWSNTDGGAGGAALPADNDTWVLCAGFTLTINVDLTAAPYSYTTGVNGITIRGGDTPATLAFKSDADGTYKLVVKAATNIVGTTAGGNRGRIFMAAGTWDSPSDVPYGRKQIIEFLGTAAGYLNAQNLDIIARCTEPTIKYARTYGVLYTVTANPDTDRIDCGTTSPVQNVTVMLTTTGTLPGGLEEDTTYWVRAVSGNTCKLSVRDSDAGIIDITSAGSGTIYMFSGHTNTSTAVMNVLDDVTTDPQWVTGATDGQVCLVDNDQSATDVQRGINLAGVAAGTLTLSANVDSAQNPGACIWLVSRNVRIISNSTSTTAYIITWGSLTTSAAASTLNCEIRAIVPAACFGVGHANFMTFGGIIANCNYNMIYGDSCSMNGILIGALGGFGVRYCFNLTINGMITGCSTAIEQNYSQCTVTGEIRGCSTGVSQNCPVTVSVGAKIHHCVTGISSCTGQLLSTVRCCGSGLARSKVTIGRSGVVECCQYGLSTGQDIIRGGTIRHNLYALYVPVITIGYGVDLLDNFDEVLYGDRAAEDSASCVLYDYSGNIGHVRSICKGGLVTTEAAPGSPPVALPYAYKMLGNSATYGLLLEFPLFAKANQQLDVTIYCKCNEDPDNWDTVPTFELLDPSYEYGNALGVLATKNAKADGGDDTDWHAFTLSYTPTADRQIILRSRARDATAFYHWMFSAGPSDAEIADAIWNYNGAEGRTLSA